MLAQFGTIRSINSTHISKGYGFPSTHYNDRILLISYFKMEDAKSAFNHLLEHKLNNENMQVDYVYDDQERALLTSIHESSDSSQSDQDGNVSEDKKKPDQAPIKEEAKTATKLSTVVAPPAEMYTTFFTPPRLSSRIPCGTFTPSVGGTNDLSKTVYVDCSECSFDTEGVNERYYCLLPYESIVLKLMCRIVLCRDNIQRVAITILQRVLECIRKARQTWILMKPCPAAVSSIVTLQDQYTVQILFPGKAAT